MDPGLERSAHELVNESEPRHLETIFRDLGEERYARPIARAIVRARQKAPIDSTIALVDVITRAVPAPARFAGGHPAKRVFQALRIAVNDELGQLDAALPLAWDVLRDRRQARRDLLSLARGPARQALPRRARAGLHLPAGPADLRLRPRARGRARQPPRDRAHARARSPPTRGRARRACASPRSSERITDEPLRRRTDAARPRPRTATAPRPHGAAHARRVAGPAHARRTRPARRPARAAPAQRRRLRAAAAAHRAAASAASAAAARRRRRRDRAARRRRRRQRLRQPHDGPPRAQPRVDRDHRRRPDRHRRDAGLDAEAQRRHRPRGRDRRARSSAATPRCKAEVSRLSAGDRIQTLAGRARLRHARARRRDVPARRATSAPTASAPRARMRAPDPAIAGPAGAVTPRPTRWPRRRRAATAAAARPARPRGAGATARRRHDRAGADRAPAGTPRRRRRRPPPRRAATATAPAAAPTAPPPPTTGAAAAAPDRAADDRRRRGDAAIVGLTERRIGLLFAIFLALLLIAASRARCGSAASRATSLQAVASTQQVDELEVPARRGAITDRNGIELAVSEPADDVAVTPYLVKQPLQVAAPPRAAARTRPQGEVLAKLDAEGRLRLPRAQPARHEVGEDQASSKIAGLQFIPSSRREYPRKWLASQVLGWVGTDGDGLAGLEYAQDDVLRGSDGERRIVKDALGEPIVAAGDRARRAPARTSSSRSTPSCRARSRTSSPQVGAGWRPKGATALVMDPYSSTILALANWPRVDANDRGGAPAYAAQNRAVGFNYEPGSTFKAVHRRRRARGEGRHARRRLPPAAVDRRRRPRRSRRRTSAAPSTSRRRRSSRSPATSARCASASASAPTRFDRWVRRFGFGRTTGIELPGEESGQVLKRDEYSGSSMGNLPIGQGESVTPMQLATAYAAIANGGILRRPRIISRDRRRARPRRRAGRRVISEAHRRAAAHDARGRRRGRRHRAAQVAIPGYTLAGKTGTANKIDRRTGEYSKTRFIALVRRLRAGAQAEAARHRHGRRAAGRDLRRRGRGAGVPGDHALRAAVPRRRARRLTGSAGARAATILAPSGDRALRQISVTRSWPR